MTSMVQTRTHRQAAIHLGKKEVIRENFDRIFQTYPCNAAAVEVEIFDCLSQTPQLLVKYDLSVILSFLLCSSASSRVFILMLNHLCYELLGENAWGSNWVRIAINKIIKKLPALIAYVLQNSSTRDIYNKACRLISL